MTADNVQDSRLTKSPGKAKRSRAQRDETENRELSDEERLEMFQQSFFQDRLPTLPKIPGFHVCWLTTSNPSDPIHRRIMLGYTLIKPEEIAGWSYTTLQSGEFAGYIGVNEMVAAKISSKLYQGYMKHTHHDEPLAEETKIRDLTEETQRQLRKKGVKAFVGEGTQQLGLDPGAPDFRRLNSETGKPYLPFERKQEIARESAARNGEEPDDFEGDGE